MSEPPVPYNIDLPLNLDSTRNDLQDLLAQLNPILQQIVSLLESNPDTTAEGMLASNFSKIMFSKISGS